MQPVGQPGMSYPGTMPVGSGQSMPMGMQSYGGNLATNRVSNQMQNQQHGGAASASGHKPQPQKRTWHSEEHNTEGGIRKSMVSRIIQLLQSRRPSNSNDWQQKLPQMARRLEEALYFNASSPEEYQVIPFT